MKTIIRIIVFNFLYIMAVPIMGQEPIILGSGGNYSNINVNSSSSEAGEVGENTINGNGMLPNLNATSRFLAQASFGGDYETILATSEMSFSDWIDQQMAMPPSFKMKDDIDMLYQMAIDSINLYGGIPSEFELGDKHFYFSWTKYMIESPDILRNRIALALSEIFVISEDPDLDDYPRLLGDYYDVLLENAFGNYRDLLEKVSLHPGMGLYLTHLNNPKTDIDNNVFPDENYAREIMQLFSIGLYELNQDGSRKIDPVTGTYLETYDETDIAEFARIFTGLSWGDAIFFGIRNPISEESLTMPMAMFNDAHESGEKQLLNGFVVPDRDQVDGNADLTDAFDNLFNHPNVGPFMAIRLIQRLVKSNPSPEYISRISAVFNDDGTGTRGNIGAMVKAILLDEEARSCNFDEDPYSGKLREPMLRHFQLSRAFNAYVPNGSGIYRDDMNASKVLLEQRPLSPPSVFNFFLPDYQPIGAVEQAGKVAPEFQITDSRTSIAYGSMLNRWLRDDDDLFDYGDLFPDEVYHKDKEGYLDLTDEIEMAADDNLVDDMVERLNLVMAAGQLKENTLQTIINTVKQVPVEQADVRVRIALFLIMYSPDYLIQR